MVAYLEKKISSVVKQKTKIEKLKNFPLRIFEHFPSNASASKCANKFPLAKN
jgi:hypothetical protein